MRLCGVGHEMSPFPPQISHFFSSYDHPKLSLTTSLSTNFPHKTYLVCHNPYILPALHFSVVWTSIHDGGHPDVGRDQRKRGRYVNLQARRDQYAEVDILGCTLTWNPQRPICRSWLVLPPRQHPALCGVRPSPCKHPSRARHTPPRVVHPGPPLYEPLRPHHLPRH